MSGKKEHSSVSCSFCGGFKNYNYGHRKSEIHQKNMTKKLKVISFHLSAKRTNAIKVHDLEWPNKEEKRFCHFCHESYNEHHPSSDLIVECLGAMYHHHKSQHIQCVKLILRENERKEKEGKFVNSDEDLNGFLQKVSDAKQKYLKKMDILNNMVLKQIKEMEHTRKEFGSDLKIATAEKVIPECSKSAEKFPKVFSPTEKSKVPPWLADVPTDSSSSEAPKSFNMKIGSSISTATSTQIEPSMDTLLKHIVKQQKKGLPAKRLTASVKNFTNKSAKWRPVFHGVWNKSRYRLKKKT